MIARAACGDIVSCFWLCLFTTQSLIDLILVYCIILSTLFVDPFLVVFIVFSSALPAHVLCSRIRKTKV